MKNIVSFFVGLTFALGLGLSNMTKVNVVRGFLDIFGDWNLALMGVMIGAIGVHSIAYFFIKKRATPLLDTKFHLPIRKELDTRLLVGAAIFGLGWGWGGICPGPGIVSLIGGKTEFIIFILCMLLGMKLFQTIEKKL